MVDNLAEIRKRILRKITSNFLVLKKIYKLTKLDTLSQNT